MVELYESHGVSPEMMEEHGFNVPEDFYTQLGQEDEAVQQIEEDFDLEGIEDTEKLYYDRREPYRQEDGSTDHFTFKADVLKIIDDEWIVLNRTMFYPQGGGQMHDVGKLNGCQVEEVQKQSGVVLHQAPEHDLEEGKRVKGVVNGEKRKQLTQHHSTTHMVNAAAREELGEHIYQAGANKTLEKARLDITHYEKPGRETLDEIEARVQELIEDDHKINVLELPKSEAEQKYGFRIYQGGAPPGNTIRLINIEDVDIEACGGTHLTRSSHAEEFYITGSKRIQDGVIRLEYKAGEAAEEFIDNIEKRMSKAEEILDVPLKSDLRLAQRELCEEFSVEPEQLLDTLERFQEEVEEFGEKIEKLSDFLGREAEIEEVEGEKLVDRARELFEERKKREKKVEKLESQIEVFLEEEIEKNNLQEIEAEVPTENVGLLIHVAQKLSNKHQACVTLIGEKGAVSASQTDESARENLEQYSDSVQGDDSFAKAFDI
jgi:alanyl-tRNA synthetase